MSRKIVLSKRASQKLDKLIDYLETEWSIRIKNIFLRKLDKSLQILKDNPDCSPKSDIVKGLHKLVITKQTTVYYKYDSERVFIVTLFDTRQNPKRLKREIK